MDSPKFGKRMSVFLGKAKANHVGGILTNRGMRQFDQARVALASLMGVPANQISDGDTVEYLARGRFETEKYLRGGMK